MRTSPAPVLAPTGDREWAIVKVTSLGHFLCHLGELIFPGAMLAMMGEFQLDPIQTTSLATLGYVLMGAGALPVGWWADGWGSPPVLLIYFFSMAAAGLVVFLAPTAGLLFVGLTLLGLATSMYHPAGLAMISLGVSKRGRALGINGLAGSCGIALGPALGKLCSNHGSWRAAYLLLAGLSALAGLLALWDLRRLSLPKRHELPLLPESLLSREPKLPADSVLQPPGELPFAPSQSLVPLLLLLLVMMFAGFNYRCLMTALPDYLSADDPTRENAVLYLLLILLVGGGIGQLVGGVMSDRWGARRVYLFLVGAFVPLSFLLGRAADVHQAAVTAGFLAIALFAQQPVENSLLAENTSTGRRSISYGVKFVLTFGVGALGTWVVGILWQEFDTFKPVFYLMAGVAAVMVFLLLGFLSKTNRRPRNDQDSSLHGHPA